MPEQERKATRTDGATAGGAGATPAGTGKKLKEAMDRLVDEIDDVLEENAEEFVKSYVQRGGE
jgi:prokaryotic ubiquitin-like protein Pup